MMDILEKANSIPGWFSDNDMNGLIDLMNGMPDDGIIIELGSWLGHSTSVLYNCKKENQSVVTIDTWLGQPDLRFDAHAETLKQDLFLAFLNNMELYATKPIWYVSGTPGYYYLRMNTEDAPILFDDKSISMIMIDADHNRVGRDIDRWKPKIKNWGIICGHDYHWGNVKEQLQGRIKIETLLDDLWIAHKEK